MQSEVSAADLDAAVDQRFMRMLLRPGSLCRPALRQALLDLGHQEHTVRSLEYCSLQEAGDLVQQALQVRGSRCAICGCTGLEQCLGPCAGACWTAATAVVLGCVGQTCKLPARVHLPHHSDKALCGQQVVEQQQPALSRLQHWHLLLTLYWKVWQADHCPAALIVSPASSTPFLVRGGGQLSHLRTLAVVEVLQHTAGQPELGSALSSHSSLRSSTDASSVAGLVGCAQQLQYLLGPLVTEALAGAASCAGASADAVRSAVSGLLAGSGPRPQPAGGSSEGQLMPAEVEAWQAARNQLVLQSGWALAGMPNSTPLPACNALLGLLHPAALAAGTRGLGEAPASAAGAVVWALHQVVAAQGCLTQSLGLLLGWVVSLQTLASWQGQASTLSSLQCSTLAQLDCTASVARAVEFAASAAAASGGSAAGRPANAAPLQQGMQWLALGQGGGLPRGPPREATVLKKCLDRSRRIGEGLPRYVCWQLHRQVGGAGYTDLRLLAQQRGGGVGGSLSGVCGCFVAWLAVCQCCTWERCVQAPLLAGFESAVLSLSTPLGSVHPTAAGAPPTGSSLRQHVAAALGDLLGVTGPADLPLTQAEMLRQLQRCGHIIYRAGLGSHLPGLMQAASAAWHSHSVMFLQVRLWCRFTVLRTSSSCFTGWLPPALKLTVCTAAPGCRASAGCPACSTLWLQLTSRHCWERRTAFC